MTVKVTENDKNFLVSVSGRVDTSTAYILDSTIIKLNDKAIEIDCTGLEYISSAGLRVLLQTHKRVGSDNLKLTNVNDNILELFEVTGFDSIINIERETI